MNIQNAGVRARRNDRHSPTTGTEYTSTQAPIRKRVCVGLLVCLLCLLGSLALAATPTKLDIVVGKPFPDLTFDGLMHPDDYRKLGLDRTEGGLRLSDIESDFLVIEFFNKSCVPCQRQVREVEGYYKKLIDDNQINKLRVLSVAVGNKAKYLERYRKKRGLTYPIATDPEFDQWRRMGEPGKTPFIVFLQKSATGWMLHSFHFGIHNQDELAKLSADLLSGYPPPMEDEGATPDWQARHLEMPLTETELEKLAGGLLTLAARDELPMETLTLADGQRVYRVIDSKTGKAYYARAATRPPVCEVCHAVHFMYAFDQTGTVLAFKPIHVTKYGNVEWNDKESKHMARRLNGRKMATLDFDPEVDAVTQATMSSALIFDEVRRTREILGELGRLVIR